MGFRARAQDESGEGTHFVNICGGGGGGGGAAEAQRAALEAAQGELAALRAKNAELRDCNLGLSEQLTEAQAEAGLARVQADVSAKEVVALRRELETERAFRARVLEGPPGGVSPGALHGDGHEAGADVGWSELLSSELRDFVRFWRDTARGLSDEERSAAVGRVLAAFMQSWASFTRNSDRTFPQAAASVVGRVRLLAPDAITDDVADELVRELNTRIVTNYTRRTKGIWVGLRTVMCLVLDIPYIHMDRAYASAHPAPAPSTADMLAELAALAERGTSNPFGGRQRSHVVTQAPRPRRRRRRTSPNDDDDGAAAAAASDAAVAAANAAAAAAGSSSSKRSRGGGGGGGDDDDKEASGSDEAAAAAVGRSAFGGRGKTVNRHMTEYVYPHGLGKTLNADRTAYVPRPLPPRLGGYVPAAGAQQ
jgi:hypothetical protein